MTQIRPSSFLDNFGHYGLVGFQLHSLISNFLMPTDFEDISKTNVFKSKDAFLQLLVEFPVFTGVHQYIQNIVVEQAQI